MELKKGDKLTLCQDEEETDNWYFFKDREHGFEIRENKAHGWIFNHALMVKAFFGHLEQDPGSSVRAMIAGQPTVLKGDKSGTKYWGILIRAQI